MSRHAFFSFCLWILTTSYAFSPNVFADAQSRAPADDQMMSPSSPLIERGDYLARIGGCVSCHSIEGQADLSGGKKISTPFGEYYSSNLRSNHFINDPSWSFSAFKKALTKGVAPGGRSYYPVFPYVSFGAMTENDVLALYTFLKSQSVVENVVPEHRPKGLARLSWSVSLWRRLYVDEKRVPVPKPQVDGNQILSDGQYLVDAVLHCGQCHTSRNRLGAIMENAYLRGAVLANGHIAPNLRPSTDGLLLWETYDIQRYLRSGKSEWGQNAADEMRDYIDSVSRHLSEQDSLLVARYLQSLPSAGDYPTCRVHGPRSIRC